MTTRLLLALLIFAAAIACSVSQRWMGINLKKDGSAVIAGHFYSLGSCQNKMKEIGGYCGKDCQDYGNGSVADCHPLVNVPKEEKR